MHRKCFAAACFFLLASPAHAQSADDWQDWPTGDRFTISATAFFPALDTKIRLDASDGSKGTAIDFEQNLGMSDTATLPRLGFSWRFAKKHRLIVDVFELDRSGSEVTTSEISFGEEVFQANLPISSFLDMRVTSIGYGYSILFDEKKELAFSAGLSVQDIKFGLIGTGNFGIIQQSAGLTAPLPSFGLNGSYALTDKWLIRGALGVFAFSLALSDEEELSGDIINALFALQHNTFENVHFSLGYSYFDVDIEFETERRLSEVNYEYHGPMLTFDFVF